VKAAATWKLAVAALVIAVVVLLYLVLDAAGQESRTAAPAAAMTPHESQTPSLAAKLGAPIPPGLVDHVVPPMGTMPTHAPALDAVDPCTEVREPEVPAGYETVAAGPVTLAWPPGVEHSPLGQPFAPLPVAHLAAGILEEAAQVTGTAMRPHVLVIVHRSLDEIRAVPGAPSWVGGLYDGAARVATTDDRILALELEALRHEIMHAQLHAGVGCMPMWLNEGLASWFAHEMRIPSWFRMLREHRVLDPAELVAGVNSRDANGAPLAYAQSLEMVMYAQDHLGGTDALLRAYIATGDPEHAWQKLFRDADSQVLLDDLAHRLFGITTGPALESLFTGVICCSGYRDPATLACRAGTRAGIDRSRTPATLCFGH
jgi:hypothetical protein